MRTIWAQAARPRLNGYGTSTCNAPAVQVIRQTTSAPIRKRLSFSDAFTLLLAPVLGTALIADTSWKDKRRKEWAHKIAEVEAETETLRAQEVRSWQALQIRSVSLGTAYQRRQYSAVAEAYAIQEGPCPLDGDQPAEGQAVEITQEALAGELEIPQWDESPMKKEYDVCVPLSYTDGTNVSDDPTTPTERTLEALKRFQRLLAIKLALQLTIHTHMGASPRFTEMGRESYDEPAHLSTPITGLVRQLKTVRRSMRALSLALPPKIRLPQKEGDAVPITEVSQRFQRALCDLAASLETNQLTVAEFVRSLGHVTMESSESPTSQTYKTVLCALSRTNHHEMAMQVLFAFNQSRQPMDDSSIFIVLRELAKRKYLHHFDWIIRNLTMKKPDINTTTKWRWVESNGISVPVPVSKHPRLLQILIHCGMRFSQTQKAEAWATIFRETWKGNRSTYQVLTNFMRYYEVERNWRQGAVWLERAREDFVTVARWDMSDLRRVTLGMLSLCLACGKREQYEQIINAAVQSRIGLLCPDYLERDSVRRKILAEWAYLHNRADHREEDRWSDEEKASVLQQQLKSLTQQSVADVPMVSAVWKSPEACELIEKPQKQDNFDFDDEILSTSPRVAKWRDLYTKQQGEVARLKIQLERSRRLCQQLEIARKSAISQTLTESLSVTSGETKSIGETQVDSHAENDLLDHLVTKSSPDPVISHQTAGAKPLLSSIGHLVRQSTDKQAPPSLKVALDLLESAVRRNGDEILSLNIHVEGQTEPYNRLDLPEQAPRELPFGSLLLNRRLNEASSRAVSTIAPRSTFERPSKSLGAERDSRKMNEEPVLGAHASEASVKPLGTTMTTQSGGHASPALPLTRLSKSNIIIRPTFSSSQRLRNRGFVRPYPEDARQNTATI